MMARDSRLALDSLTTLDRIGIGLATVTAIVHLVLGVPGVPSPQGISFVLAALRFFGGIASSRSAIGDDSYTSSGSPSPPSRSCCTSC